MALRIEWMNQLRRLHRNIETMRVAVEAGQELALLRPNLPPPAEASARLAEAEAEYAQHARQHPELAREYETRLEIQELEEQTLPAARRRLKALRTQARVTAPPSERRVKAVRERLAHLQERLAYWQAAFADEPSVAHAQKVERAQARVDMASRNLARMTAPRPESPAAEIAFEEITVEHLESRLAALKAMVPDVPTPWLMGMRRTEPVTNEEVVLRILSTYTTDGTHVLRRSTGLPVQSSTVTVKGEKFRVDDIFKMLGGDK